MYLYKSSIAYDGTFYFGWQKTRMGPSIQETLQAAIYRVTGENILPEAASRTDRGVHAEGQVVAFRLKKEWDLFCLLRALNAMLPCDIRIIDLQKAPIDFHPTLQAIAKEYHYHCCLGPVQDPIHRFYSWAIRPPLCTQRMQQAAQDFVGTKDFSAFANLCEKKPFCQVNQIEIIPLEGNRLQIAITGNRFLYKMVRNMVGTLIYIGCGKLDIECIPKILTSKDRKAAGPTAPAHGLTLYKVRYSQ